MANVELFDDKALEALWSSGFTPEQQQAITECIHSAACAVTAGITGKPQVRGRQ